MRYRCLWCGHEWTSDHTVWECPICGEDEIVEQNDDIVENTMNNSEFCLSMDYQAPENPVPGEDYVPETVIEFEPVIQYLNYEDAEMIGKGEEWRWQAERAGETWPGWKFPIEVRVARVIV